MEEVRTLLEQRGVTVTAKREMVVRALLDAGCPLTPQELLGRLAGGLNRVTLYRILALLVKKKLVTRHNAGERAFRYCLQRGPNGHAHFTCVRCGRTQCLDSAGLDACLAEFAARLPMRVDVAEVHFDGVCAECLARGAA